MREPLHRAFAVMFVLATAAGCGTRTDLSPGDAVDAPAETEGALRCAPEDAVGSGACFLMFGYRWNGSRCVGVGGCGCTGAACSKLAETPEACEAAHRDCP